MRFGLCEDEIGFVLAESAVDPTGLREDEDKADFDGAAKVALLGIERSFAAWSVLRGAIPDAT